MIYSTIFGDYDRGLVICDDIMMTYALMMYADL